MFWYCNDNGEYYCEHNYESADGRLFGHVVIADSDGEWKALRFENNTSFVIGTATSRGEAKALAEQDIRTSYSCRA